MSEPFIAQISMFAGNFAPRSYAFCNGQILAISQNTALFSLIGTNFGGNGTSNFALPNLQAKAPLGVGQGVGLTGRVIGETGGVAAVSLLLNQIPGHSHTANCDGAVGTLPDPGGHVWAASAGGRGRPTTYGTTSGGAMSAQAIGPTGGNAPHNNLSPYQAVSFIIALFGIFPSRN
jgi:microcystin-dependent protein